MNAVPAGDGIQRITPAVILCSAVKQGSDQSAETLAQAVNSLKVNLSSPSAQDGDSNKQGGTREDDGHHRQHYLCHMLEKEWHYALAF